ncbi:hypothetical protein ACEWY4_020635 [Coilia grayii]|uniref:Gypsy retrotransposon integrase-like protein 1 n=1 Tax=Coilia grayii TaxID=363190 RepID=A0ABD1J6N5_9TELE
MMGNKRRQQTEAAEEEEDSPQQALENSVQQLQSMFQAFLVTQQRQEQRAVEEQTRQDQRWRGIVHQFSRLQEEVRQERGELSRGRGGPTLRAEQHGISLSAPVSTAVSPAHALQVEDYTELQRGASEDQGAGGAVAMPAAAAMPMSAAAGVPGPPAGRAAAAAAVAAAAAAAAAAQPAMVGVQAAALTAGPGAVVVPGPAAQPAMVGVQAAAAAAPAATAGPGVVVVPGPATQVAMAGIQAPAAHVFEGMQATGWRGPKMQKYSNDEDIEHFLTTFERVATASLCPKAQWALHLVPLLTGKARAAYIAMDFAEAMDYDQVKTVILEKFEINPETYRQRFRSTQMLPDESPKELFTRLRELYEKWTRPQVHSKEEIGDMLILEQFLRMVSSDVRLWIREHNPKTSKEAVVLAESFVAARRGSRPYQNGGRDGTAAQSGKSESGWRGDGLKSPRPVNADVKCFYCGQSGHIKPKCPNRKPKTSNVSCVPNTSGGEATLDEGEAITVVRVNGKQVQALVDTGSSQTIVRGDLVAQHGTPTDGRVLIRCVHGDERSYPTAEVHLEVEKVSYLVTVALAEKLPYPVVLGRDIPDLMALVEGQSCNMAVTRAQAQKTDRDTTWELLPFADIKRKTRSQKRTEKFRGTKLTEIVPQPELDTVNLTIPADIIQAQRADRSLQPCYADLVADENGDALGPKFKLKSGILYRHGEDGEQLVLPSALRNTVMEVGHATAWAGHLGQNKTWDRIVERFYWPKMYSDVVKFCKTCAACQLTAPGRKGDRVPLVPMPVIDVPFSRVAMDIVGPLERSRKGNRYILVIADYATRYPEAFPLRNIKARQVANAFLQLVTRVGVPREVLTDQGTNFTSSLLKDVYKYLGIKGIKTTPYHPQTDGLVERFNKTLKSMLRKFVSDSGSDWDDWLPYLLFAYREVPQASTGFSPFELLYGRHVRGPLDVLKEAWEGKEPEQKVNVLAYVLKMRDRMQSLTEMVQEKMKSAQAKQRKWYDASARERSLQPGQQVLVLLPTSESSLLAKWQGPYIVQRRAGKVTYEISTPDKKKQTQTFHINMLREWHEKDRPVDNLFARAVEEEEEAEEQYFPVQQEGVEDVILSHLSDSQQRELRACIPEGVFKGSPGKTRLVQHHIRLKSPGPVRLPCYRIPAQLLPKIKGEIDSMLNMGIIEPSTSEWSSPVVLVPKKDGSLRFCMDFRKLNSLSTVDPYPMPRIDDLIDRLGGAKYLTTLDLSKGYWQVPMSSESKPLTAFKTPFGFYQFCYMPFGLQGAPATFQRLMDRVLKGAEMYSAAYLDDVVIHSCSWKEHLVHVKEVLRRLKEAGLTVNPEKCAVAQREVQYLGYVIGGGVMKPQVGKVSAILETPVPTTKRQVRSFLGVVGWYRCFVPHFSTRAAPLIELTRKSAPNRVVWTDQCAQAFEDLRTCLTKDPILQSPDFSQPFLVQTDASAAGLGAVLLQGPPGEQKPVVFLSRKLFPREVRYSTVEKEGLAIKWALDSLKYYLMDKDFVLETDHRALQWLDKMKDTNSRVTRWYLSLQPFRFTVKYRAGPDNVVADYLSRVYEEDVQS